MEVVVTSKGISVNSRDREFIETKIPAALRSVASITKSIKVQAGYEGNYYTLEAQADKFFIDGNTMKMVIYSIAPENIQAFKDHMARV